MQIISPEWKIQAGKTLSSSGLRPARYHRPVSTKENAVAIEMGHAIIATLASSPFKRQSVRGSRYRLILAEWVVYADRFCAAIGIEDITVFLGLLHMNCWPWLAYETTNDQVKNFHTVSWQAHSCFAPASRLHCETCSRSGLPPYRSSRGDLRIGGFYFIYICWHRIRMSGVSG